jgi:aminoglycoside phosphotransferase (APT) family kinase protein
LGTHETQPLARLVEAMAPGATLLDHWTLTGGVSAQTSALEILRQDGTTQRLVLHAHGPRDLARDPAIALHEYQLLQTLHEAGLPVPRPVFVDQTGELSGSPSVVTEFVEGEVRTADTLAPSARSITQMAYWLSRIHRFDLRTADLSFLVEIDYEDPDRLQPRSDDSPLVQRICDALGAAGRVEPTNTPVLLHGDYWMGNLLWNGDGIVAIIDWEDAFIGDPVLDLARSRLELFWAHGPLESERFTAQYLGWNDIDIDHLAWWDLLMSLQFARALPGWGLPADRERQMHTLLEQFVERALETR